MIHFTLRVVGIKICSTKLFCEFREEVIYYPLAVKVYEDSSCSTVANFTFLSSDSYSEAERKAAMLVYRSMKASEMPKHLQLYMECTEDETSKCSTFPRSEVL